MMVKEPLTFGGGATNLEPQYSVISNGFLNWVLSVLNCGVLGVRISVAKAVYDQLGCCITKPEKSRVNWDAFRNHSHF